MLKPPVMAQEKTVSLAGDTAADLDKVAQEIQREEALAAKEKEVIVQKEEKLLNALPSSPDQGFSFTPSPALSRIGAGLAVWGLEWVLKAAFHRGLRPLSSDQQDSLEQAIANTIQKYTPLFMSKFLAEHGAESNIVFALVDIGLKNNIELPGPVRSPSAAEKAPSVASPPRENVTVITAETPPLPAV